MRTWVISDLHIGHDNIIKYCNRPFENSYRMNQAIRDNWNKTVAPNDIVYNLGDVYFGKNWTGEEIIIDFLNSLNGKKYLVLGNHDNGRDQVLTRTFAKIEAWYKISKKGIILSHFPLHESIFNDNIKYNIHGHIHNTKFIKDKRYINVSVEVINYTPVELDSLI